MGGSGSKDDDDLGPLPQQQIVTMTDGQPSNAASVAPGVSRVGQSMKSTAVLAPLRLLRVLWNAAGNIEVELSASRNGVVFLIAPALELERTSDGDESNNADSKTLWPVLQGDPLRKRVSASERCTIAFEGSREMLAAHRQNSKVESLGDGTRRWPIVLQLVPAELEVISAEPPDGSLMACCFVEGGQVKIDRQLIAWGGEGTAYVLKELFGIQEATSVTTDNADIVDNQAQCVVCLTSLKDTALMPCGHFCVCYDCGVSIRLSPARNRCPLCRSDVHDIIHINVASRTDLSVPSVPTAQSSTSVMPPVTEGAKLEEVLTAPEIEETTHSGIESIDTAKRGAASMEEVRAARLRRLEHSQQPDVQQPESVSLQPQALGDGVNTINAPASGFTAGSSGSLPPKCLQRLTREMRQIEENKAVHLTEHGITISLADPEGSDLRIWRLLQRTEKVDADSQLGKALRTVGAADIEFEVWIPDGFPIEPPRVRVLRPTFQPGSFWVQAHGALCMEILTQQGWSPAVSLLQLGVAIKTTMTAGAGSIASLNPIGDGCREQAWKAFERVENAHGDWNRFNLQ